MSIFAESDWTGSSAFRPTQRKTMNPKFLLILCLTIICKSSMASSEVRIYLGDLFDATGQMFLRPIKSLSRVIASTKDKRNFRVIWADGSPNMGTIATVLYSRKHRTLTFYSYTTIGGIGNENVKPIRSHWRFYEVKDYMIHKIAKKHKNVSEVTGDYFFDEIALFGCKRRNLLRHE